MSMLVLVRSVEDLARSCIELNGFFSFRRRQYPLTVLETLLGIWIDPRMAAEPPGALVHNQAAYHPVRIRETFGLQAIWALGWFETPAGEYRGELPRLDLLGALIASASQWQDGMPSGRFIPVFPSKTASSEVQIEMRSLLSEHPHDLMSPWFQDAATGLLIRPEVDEAALQVTCIAAQ
jgi:hypothetical protein